MQRLMQVHLFDATCRAWSDELSWSGFDESRANMEGCLSISIVEVKAWSPPLR